MTSVDELRNSAWKFLRKVRDVGHLPLGHISHVAPTWEPHGKVLALRLISLTTDIIPTATVDCRDHPENVLGSQSHMTFHIMMVDLEIFHTFDTPACQHLHQIPQIIAHIP